MEFNLQTLLKEYRQKLKDYRYQNEHDQHMINEFLEKLEGFEKQLREIKDAPLEWWSENQLAIISRFEHHSNSGITPYELLVYFIVYFIEKEILGDNQVSLQGDNKK